MSDRNWLFFWLTWNIFILKTVPSISLSISAEQFNQTLIKMLSTLSEEPKTDWKSYVAPPLLEYADYRKPFILHTDASSKGLRAVLYQYQGGRKRVIAYASRGLRPSEHNYTAHKREFLAIKWAVCDKLHDYLYGNQFEVITDNNPLTYIFTKANPEVSSCPC